MKEIVEQITAFTQTNLIGPIKQIFATLPDAPFSLCNLRPFWITRKRWKKKVGNNARSRFGIHLIPGANQIRNLLDPVPAETISPIYRDILRGLQQSGKLNCNDYSLDRKNIKQIEVENRK